MLAPLQLDCRSKILVGGYLGEVMELAEFLVLFSSCAIAFLILTSWGHVSEPSAGIDEIDDMTRESTHNACRWNCGNW